MSDPRPVHLSSSGPPDTVLDPEPVEALSALALARALPPEEQAEAVRAVVARWPRCLEAWADLGERARDDVEAYACFRVGYHRGLDRLRAAGWRGTGYVRSSERANVGFLRCLTGLSRAAATLGEHDEAERCATFRAQLDPAPPG